MLLYKEVKEKIIQALSAGTWQAGDKLPIESELAEKYDVSKSTIRAAVGELVDAGILDRKQGKGTFVATEAASRNLYRFFYLVDAAGKRRYPTRSLVSLKRTEADDDIVQALDLYRYGKQRDVYSIQMIFKIDGQPIGHSNPIVPVALFPNLSADIIKPDDVSLYSLYHKLFNVNIIRVAAHMAAASATPAIARELKVQAQAPLLLIERTAYTYQDVPVEYRTIMLNSSIVRYKIEQGSSV